MRRRLSPEEVLLRDRHMLGTVVLGAAVVFITLYFFPVNVLLGIFVCLVIKIRSWYNFFFGAGNMVMTAIAPLWRLRKWLRCCTISLGIVAADPGPALYNLLAFSKMAILLVGCCSSVECEKA